MSQKFESNISKVWGRRIIESPNTQPIIEKMCRDYNDHVERVIRQHMDKTERFIFDRFKSRRIKKFALRKFRTEIDNSDMLNMVTRVYKNNKLIDTITVK